MMITRHRVALVSVLMLCGIASGEETLREISWSALAREGRLLSGQLVAPDERTPFEQLKIENTTEQFKSFPIFVLEQPGITRASYAIVGNVRYEGVRSDGYLETWSQLPGGQRFFSRTLATTGPMRSLQGSSDGRTFMVSSFIADESVGRPERIEFNLVLPGPGVVYLGPLRLVHYTPGELEHALADLASAGGWWNERSAGWIGGIGGAVLGCMGGLIGWLVSRGRARKLVTALAVALLVIGIGSLIAGVVAVLTSQPYAVYYPLLLIGGLCTVISPFCLRNIGRRYADLELRRMDTIDAS